MGLPIEFNWVLKLKPEQGFNQELGEHEFVKQGYRVFPINIPLDLVTKDIEAVAKVIVLEIQHKDNKTIGKYKVLRQFNEQEKEFITKYWEETVNFKDE